MTSLASMHTPPLVAVGTSLVGASAMIAWRLREASRPVTIAKIVGPPLGMSTGLAMFLAPAVRVPWSWAAAAFLLGAAVLAIPLARTSTLIRSGGVVLLRRSPAFLGILGALVVARLMLRAYVERVASPAQSSGLLFLVAFGMILRWRVGMLRAFLRV